MVGFLGVPVEAFTLYAEPKRRAVAARPETGDDEVGDAFEERHQALLKEKGADPEDRDEYRP